jgi:hypothetical protein
VVQVPDANGVVRAASDERARRQHRLLVVARRRVNFETPDASRMKDEGMRLADLKRMKLKSFYINLLNLLPFDFTETEIKYLSSFLQRHPPVADSLRFCLKLYLYNMFQLPTGSSSGINQI